MELSSKSYAMNAFSSTKVRFKHSMIMKQLFQKSNIQLTGNQLIIIVSIYFVGVLNFTFLSEIYERIFAQSAYNIAFAISVPFLLFSLLLIFFSSITNRYILKPILIIMTLLSSLIFYGSLNYGVVFDYDMMQNLVETDSSEAFSYLNLNVVIYFILLGLLPSIFIIRANLNYQNFFSEILQRIKLITVAFVVCITISYSFYSNYASIGRNNSHLTHYLVPLQFVHSGFRVLRDRYFQTVKKFEILDNEPYVSLPPKYDKNVVVMVVGETARAMNFSYNGYAKVTNQYTQNFAITSFQHMLSCGTSTNISIPCMFSSLAKKNYTKKNANSQQNLLDIVNLAGVDVLWIDNNSGCKNVCERVNTILINAEQDSDLCDGDYCYDEILLSHMSDKLTHLRQRTTLIVLHMIGSHGPSYYKRYPKDQALFTPDCQRSDIQNCSKNQLMNTYDNTIAYSDYILSKVVEELSLLPKNVASSMLYVSDHGESLGEQGAYLHGFPYSFAPDEQTNIPMLVWLNNVQNEIDIQCLDRVSELSDINHDYIFSSMLDLLNVKSSLYNESRDVFQSCKV